MKRLPLLLVCCALVLFSGLVYGLWTDRWYSSILLEEAAARVMQVPTDVGDWHGENQAADERAFAQAGAQTYWVRRYQNSKTGATVTVILMCGRGGRMSVHTPDVCYQSSGVEMLGEAKKISVPIAGASAAEFKSGTFSTEKSPGASQLRLYWAWSSDGVWQAPYYPRFTFQGRPFLFKLYVLREFVPGTEAVEADPGVTFLQQLLPQLNKTLFPNPPS
jgi:hypothetical protein